VYKGLKRLLAITVNPLETYAEKGTISWFRRYLNPSDYFDDLIVIYPFSEKRKSTFHGIRRCTIKRRFILIDYLLLFITTIRLVLSKNISVIRSYGPGLEGLVAVLAGYFTRRKSVISVHGLDEKIMKTRGFSFPVRIAMSIIIRTTLHLASEVWCVSQGVADEVSSKGIKQIKTKIIYNKIEISRISSGRRFRAQIRDSLGIKKEDFVLIHLGRFSPDKNLSLQIKTLDELKKKGYSSIVLLFIGGSFKDSVTAKIREIGYRRDVDLGFQIEKEIMTLGLQKEIKILGFKPHTEVPNYLGAADAYFCTMRLYGFGIALAEAQAAGLPIIANEVFCSKDGRIIVNPSTSLMYKEENPTKIANLIVQLISDTNLYKRLSQNAQKNVRRFDWKHIEEREAQFYESVINP
jgi:glycosyltransferase involved in cell wall biosynthesis